MILVIDIGNTNVVCGIHHMQEWITTWRWETQVEDPHFFAVQMTHRLFELSVAPNDITSIVVSSVVPEWNETFKELLAKQFSTPALWVGPKILDQLKIRIDRPHEIGSDLVANAFACYKLYGGEKIVVDFGTALTFTMIDRDGGILGVNIAPGLKTAIQSLFQKTAQLPVVPLKVPETFVGKNTVEAIQTGVLHGYVGLVRYQIEGIRKQLGQNFQAVATGGLSAILSPLANDFDYVNPHLTLEGLRLIGIEFNAESL